MPFVRDLYGQGLNAFGVKRALAMAHLFRVSISGYYNADFISCSGLGGELQTFEYREGGENNAPHLFPDYMKWSDISLSKGEVTNDSDLWHWFRTYFQLEGSGVVKPSFTRNIKIEALDNNNEAIIVFRVYKAFIKKLEEGGFDSLTSAFRVNTVVIQHHGVNAEYPLMGSFNRG